MSLSVLSTFLLFVFFLLVVWCMLMMFVILFMIDVALISFFLVDPVVGFGVSKSLLSLSFFSFVFSSVNLLGSSAIMVDGSFMRVAKF